MPLYHSLVTSLTTSLSTYVLYLGSSLGQSDDLTEIAGDVDVHSPSQVPRFHDPRVILSPE